MENLDKEIMDLLQRDSEKAISLMYDHYYRYLMQVVYRVLQDQDHSQDIVQSVFFEIWKKRDTLIITSSLKQYLRRAAVNKSLNFIRATKNFRDDSEPEDDKLTSESHDQSHEMELMELKERIAFGLESLPERCRLVFTLSRFEDMSNKQIADNLDISIKTVENQMTKALKLMREIIYKEF